VTPHKPKESATKHRFSPTPFGFLRYRWRKGAKLQPASWAKWRPILLQLEALREELFGLAWRDIELDDIAYELIPQLYRRCKSKKGRKPSSNTLRGRYDATKIYFDFLIHIGELAENPCTEDWVRRPTGKPNDRPFLETSEDKALALLPKIGHEIAIYALARGAALREGEICELEDEDVDFVNDVIRIRGGKTANAVRRVPLLPTAKLLLIEYVEWRDRQPGRRSPKFVRTQSGAISKAYVWKLTKAMTGRASLRLVYDNGEIVRNPDGTPQTDVTPHALRRTFITDFANRGVPTFHLAAIVGHGSPRVIEESYAMSSQEVQARQLLLAAGDGPFSAASAVKDIEASLGQVRETAANNASQALEEVRRLRNLATQLEQTLAAALTDDDAPLMLRAVA
jgi:integrase